MHMQGGSQTKDDDKCNQVLIELTRLLNYLKTLKIDWLYELLGWDSLNRRSASRSWLPYLFSNKRSDQPMKSGAGPSHVHKSLDCSMKSVPECTKDEEKENSPDTYLNLLLHLSLSSLLKHQQLLLRSERHSLSPDSLLRESGAAGQSYGDVVSRNRSQGHTSGQSLIIKEKRYML